MIHGTATPEAQVLNEALPEWHIKATEYQQNPAAEAYPHPPSEYDYGKSACYVTIVRTGKKATYSQDDGYGYSDDPQWWVYRHCPASKGVPRHDLDATVGANDGRVAADLAAAFAEGASSQEAQELKRRRTSRFRHEPDDFDFSFR